MPDTRGSVRLRKKAPTSATDQPGDETPTGRVEEIEDDESDELVEKPKPTTKELVKDEDRYSPWVDVLRVLTFLLLASGGLSYLISGGESFTWGVRHPPKYLQVDWWKAQMRGPIRLTIDELAQYDGKDTSKPLYLAINGTIYDVSVNRRTYGPGGSYQFFAGVDAARAYVTGCFAEDRTADMRGVEEMFLPLDDPEIDSRYTTAEMAALKKKEMEEARQKAHEGLAHWVNFFKNSKKYQAVGYVKRDKDWLDKEPKKTLCPGAQKGRQKRKLPGQ